MSLIEDSSSSLYGSTMARFDGAHDDSKNQGTHDEDHPFHNDILSVVGTTRLGAVWDAARPDGKRE